MPRFIDMTDAQKSAAWKRHIANGGVGSKAAAVKEAEAEVAEAKAKLAANPESRILAAFLRNAERRLETVKGG